MHSVRQAMVIRRVWTAGLVWISASPPVVAFMGRWPFQRLKALVSLTFDHLQITSLRLNSHFFRRRAEVFKNLLEF